MTAWQPSPLDLATGDLLELLAELDAPPLIAPQTYTQDLHPVAEFERSRAAWIKTNGHFNVAHAYPGWTRNQFDFQPSTSGHSFQILQALRPRTTASGEEMTGRLTEHRRGVCEDCGWHTEILTGEEDVRLEALWLDHAWPDWRELPTIPTSRPELSSTPSKAQTLTHAAWLAQVEGIYPEGWGRPGAPIVTRRGQYGHRSVPERSPWGGFDLSPQTQQHQPAAATTAPPKPSFAPPVGAPGLLPHQPNDPSLGMSI